MKLLAALEFHQMLSPGACQAADLPGKDEGSRNRPRAATSQDEAARELARRDAENRESLTEWPG